MQRVSLIWQLLHHFHMNQSLPSNIRESARKSQDQKIDQDKEEPHEKKNKKKSRGRVAPWWLWLERRDSYLMARGSVLLFGRTW